MDTEDTGYGKSDIINSSALDAPEFPYLPQLPKSYRPEIGLIGCGGISEYHLQAYVDLGLDVVALCSRDISKAEAHRDRFYPDAQVFDDYRELLKCQNIDIIDATPHPPERVAIIEDSLRAGKHVLSQKPFVLDLEVGEGLVTLAQEQNCLLAVNQNGRWAPHFSYMRHAIAAGCIGEVSHLSLSMQWDHSWTADTPFDDLEHLLLYDFAVHWFDICTVFFGNQDALSVSAQLKKSPQHKNKSPMIASIIIDYPSGQACLNFNGHVIFGQQDQMTVSGDKGTLRSTGPSLSEQTVTLSTTDGHTTPDLQGDWFTNGFQGTMSELCCAIAEDRPPFHSAQNNLRTLALTYAALASADDGGLPKVRGEVRQAPT